VYLDITKYIAFELNTLVDIDKNAEKYALQGAHDQTKLQDLLNGFLEKFVLCRRCQLPETKLVSQNLIDVLMITLV